MGLFDLLEEETKKSDKKQKKDVQDTEIIEILAAEDKKEVSKKEEKFKKTATKKENKINANTEVKKTTKSEKKKATKKEETYKYPFNLYTEGHTVDISNYGFEDNKEYTVKEICDIMLKHRHYEFASEITFKMFEDDNMLVATTKQYAKG